MCPEGVGQAVQTMFNTVYTFLSILVKYTIEKTSEIVKIKTGHPEGRRLWRQA